MMERERHSRDLLDGQSDDFPDGRGVDEGRADAEQLLAAADQLLDSIRVADAEGFLHSNRQRGGQ
jgi:hypothetical protein